MATQFEFRLIGVDAPEGELGADQLLAIVASLKEVASKIGRSETDAEPLGRAPRRTQRVATLTIGMVPGSTCLRARRAGAEDALDFDLTDEQGFDQGFADLVESIALDRRPDWVSDTLSRAAAELTGALKRAASEVEFKVGGRVRSRFATEDVRRETWAVTATRGPDRVTFTGRLYLVDLNTHRLAVQDDVGHRVSLPGAADDAQAGRLVGTYVTVVGSPEYDADDRLTHIHDAAVVAAPDPLGGSVVPEAVPLDEILASAPGPDPDGGIELTDEEFAAFLEAARG